MDAMHEVGAWKLEVFHVATVDGQCVKVPGPDWAGRICFPDPVGQIRNAAFGMDVPEWAGSSVPLIFVTEVIWRAAHVFTIEEMFAILREGEYKELIEYLCRAYRPEGSAFTLEDIQRHGLWAYVAGGQYGYSPEFARVGCILGKFVTCWDLFRFRYTQ
ncbi:hypothetical protein HGA91_01750 [candidate division WWE3 bacterium]|nr:hypothetical protein [candidate division WWE3 bacterium]